LYTECPSAVFKDHQTTIPMISLIALQYYGIKIGYKNTWEYISVFWKNHSLVHVFVYTVGLRSHWR